MNLLITTAGKLLKTVDGKYWAKIIYGYSFYENYLKVFDEITVFSQVRLVDYDLVEGCLLVSGPRLNVVELTYTKGLKDYIKEYNNIKRQIKAHIDTCDCAIVRPPDQISYYIVKEMQKKGKPVAVEVTTDVWNYLAKGNNSIPFRPFFRLMWTLEQRKLCAKAEGSAYVSNYLREAYPSRHQMNIGDEEAFDEVFTDVGLTKEWYQYEVPQYVAPLKKVRLIHVAANLGNDGKGYSELIKAVAKLRNDFKYLELVVIGDGDFSKSTSELVNHLDMNEYIVKTGKISCRSELFELLRSSDAFVFPSYSEGMPRTLLEAMVNGCVCVTSDLPGCREVLSSNVVVPAKNDEALYQKLKEILNNIDMMNEEKKRNYARAKDFSADSVEKKRIGFYRALYTVCERRKKSV